MSLFSRRPKDHEAQVSKQAMEACEAIITEMGAELHDDLIQRLTLLRYSLDRLEHSLSGNRDVGVLLVGIKSEFQEVIESVRKTSRKLLPVLMEDNSFQQNIAILCQNLEKPGTGTIHFESQGTEQKIPILAETYLYRIVQELIHNAFKHSSAWHVWVRMLWAYDLLTIEVEDDGSGFAKIDEFINLLNKKHNTLKMRSLVIHASVHYLSGKNGLLARVIFPYSFQPS
jgi:signal transduction histidine kinase